MPSRTGNNFAFIDSANLHLGIQDLGWKIDYKRLRIYLKDKYAVTKAYMFMGFSPSQQSLYKNLQEWGYILIFKPVLVLPNGRMKGNCDSELVLRAMIDLADYDKAVIVSGDGDLHCLVEHLIKLDKLEAALAPSQQNCSSFLRKTAAPYLAFLGDQRAKLAYTKNTPGGRNLQGGLSS